MSPVQYCPVLRKTASERPNEHSHTHKAERNEASMGLKNMGCLPDDGISKAPCALRPKFQPSHMMMRKTMSCPILAKPESSPEIQKPPFHDLSFMLTGNLQPRKGSVRLRQCSCNLRDAVGCSS